MKRLILILTILSSLDLCGQNLDTLYFDSAHRQTHIRANTRYVRVIHSYDKQSDQFWATDYNVMGRKVFEGQLRFVNYLFTTGKYKSFYDNGAVEVDGKAENFLSKDFQVEEHLYYPNGQDRAYQTIRGGVLKLFTHYDSLGVMDVKDGNGYCVCRNFAEKIISEGQLKNGVREGKWIIKDFNGTLKSRELYSKGAFVSGTGNSTPYSVEAIHYSQTVEKQIERLIKQRIKSALKKTIGQRREIFYLIHAKADQVIDVEILLDNFMIQNGVMPRVPIDQKLIVRIEGSKREITVPVKFKMKV